MTSCCVNSPSRYGVHNSSNEIVCFNESDHVSFIYLNVIHESMEVGADGFIESSTLGPL